MSRAFRCTDPDALATYREAETARRQFGAKVQAAAEALGAESAFGSVQLDGSLRITGLVRCEPAPDGWRWTPSRRCMRPITGKAGDPARQWLKEHRGVASGVAHLAKHHGLALLSTSVPHSDGSAYWSAPRVTEVDGQLLALYKYDDVDPQGPLWSEIKLSEYHALVESQQEAVTTGGAS